MTLRCNHFNQRRKMRGTLYTSCGTELTERKRRGNIGALSSFQVGSHSSDPGHGFIKKNWYIDINHYLQSMVHFIGNKFVWTSLHFFGPREEMRRWRRCLRKHLCGGRWCKCWCWWELGKGWNQLAAGQLSLPAQGVRTAWLRRWAAWQLDSLTAWQLDSGGERKKTGVQLPHSGWIAQTGLRSNSEDTRGRLPFCLLGSICELDTHRTEI